jgi:hypothetical protein
MLERKVYIGRSDLERGGNLMNHKIKMLWLAVAGILLVVSWVSAQAQTSDTYLRDKDLLGANSNTKSFSLLDPSRLKLSQSYSFSYFSSGKTNGSYGVYSTTLQYQVSNPLSLTLSLNYLHQPLSVFQKDNLGIKSAVLPNFQLSYRPSNSFSFMLNVVTYPSAYYWGNENPWWEHHR